MIEDTLPKLLRRNYNKYGDRKIAMRNKENGLWRSYKWSQIYETIKYFSLGLISMGFGKENKISIIGDNEPEWYLAELAAQAAGGATIGIFVDASSKELVYILNHSDSIFVIARDQEQVDKILSAKDELPDIRKIIYWDDKGMWSYDDSILLHFSQVITAGKNMKKPNRVFLKIIWKKAKALTWL